MEKKHIRKEIFQKRGELTEIWIREESRRICQKIIHMKAFSEAKTIYVYMDCKGEASTKCLMEEAWRLGKKVAAPKVMGEDMKYYLIQSYEDVAPGYFQVPEPITTEEAKDEKALLIVPGVAFDPERNRCGYGKGFYDRYLSEHQEHPTIAIAFDFQVLPQIPWDSHDVRPQVLVTPSAVYQN